MPTFSLCAVGGKAGAAELRRAQTMGFVCGLARCSVLHAQSTLEDLMNVFDSAIQLDQVRTYFSDYGEHVGYVIWAFLSPAVERRFLAGKDLSLHITEWNEGTSLWIIDFLVPRGSLTYVLEDLRDNLFRDHETVTYFRVRKGTRIFKRISRSDGGWFFRNH